MVYLNFSERYINTLCAFVFMKQKIKAVFLDRDGILNYNVLRENADNTWIDDSPFSLDELRFVDNLKDDIMALKNFGKIIVVTNQPGYLKRDIPLKVYEEITSKLCDMIDIERSQVFECFHKSGFSKQCLCRKPAPGLILMAVGVHNINLSESVMVGDSWMDIKAAIDAGIKTTYFVRRPLIKGLQIGNHRSENQMAEMGIKVTYKVNNLGDVVRIMQEK